MTLTELWLAFNQAYERYPGDPLHPERVAAREQLWFAIHQDWIDVPCDDEIPF